MAADVPHASDLPARIGARAALAGVDVVPSLANALAAYIRLLARWNQTINLTALRVDPPDEDAIDRLLVEPLAAVAALDPHDEFIVDVGSGGGSPALPMKLAAPACRFLLVESKARKAAFLREAVRQLRLEGVTVDNRRLDDVAASRLQPRADVATMRAVKVEAGVIAALREILNPRGRVFAFVGAEGDPAFPSASSKFRPLVPDRGTQLVVVDIEKLR